MKKGVIIAIVAVVVVSAVVGFWYWNKNKKAKGKKPLGMEATDQIVVERAG